MKLMIKSFVLIQLFQTHLLFAQEAAEQLPSRLSLDEAVTWALQHNPEMEAKSLQSQIASEKTAEVRYRLLPSIYANYDLRRNLIIPSTPVPSYIFNPSAPKGEFTALKFNTNWESSAGLNASVNLFDPQAYSTIREREGEKALTDIERAISKAELKAEVSIAYVECVIALEQVDLAKNDTLNSGANLRAVNEKYGEGKAKITEVNQASIALNEAANRLREAQRLQERAFSKLAYYLGSDGLET